MVDVESDAQATAFKRVAKMMAALEISAILKPNSTVTCIMASSQISLPIALYRKHSTIVETQGVREICYSNSIYYKNYRSN